MNPDSKQRLAGLIDEFLEGALAFDAFQEAYSRAFIDELPEDALSSAELGAYGDVHERAEWTAPAPSPEDRAHGWMDVAEFSDWLRAHRVALRRQ